MGRLLTDLIAESHPATAAIPAIPANPPAPNSGIARIAAPGALVPDAEEASFTADQLAALESMKADTAERMAGRVPKGDTAAMICRHCGPVYVHPSIAACLPVVAGWPRALGCPWCFVRKAGRYIPRPMVACENCVHYRPDTINPVSGMGTCCDGGMHYPMERHRCGTFLPRVTP